MRRTLISALLVVVAALLVVGLTLSKATGKRADLRVMNGTEPQTLDPDLATGDPEHRILEDVFEGLARLDSASLEPVPGVAESWDISADGKTYVFHLRPTARWSDGRPVTAHDFTYAWRRLQDPTLGGEYAYIMHMVRWAEARNTYGAQAEALRGRVVKALDELVAQHPSVVPGAALREFAKKLNLQATLKGTPNPALRSFLLRPDGDIETDELRGLRPELLAEAARRQTAHDAADEHFGVDEGVFAKDDHTLVVELNAATPYFLELTAFYPFYPVPRWAVERASRNWFMPGNFVGNGAFTLESWRVGDRIVLERNPQYWGKNEVKLKRVDLLPIENMTTALNLYLTGDVDWIPHGYYPRELGPDLKRRADFYGNPALIAYYYRINTTRKPFGDKRVRKALNLAIDREQITRDVLLMGEQPAYTVVPPGLRGYTSGKSEISLNVAEARKLLAEAGFPEGRGFPKFGILYNTMEMHKKLAEVVADQLRRNLNIDAVAYNQEWQSYQQSTTNMDYDVSRYGWVGDYEDPNTFLDVWLTNGGNNRTGWGSLVYDRLIESANNVELFLDSPEFLLQHTHEPQKLRELMQGVRAAREPAARLEAMSKLRLALLAEAETILVADDFPIIPLYFYVISGLVKPYVRGFHTEIIGSDGSKRPNLRDLHPLRDLSVEGAP
ncbi:MAG TPA: peptide ABC transporter substrate-binding protein [Polyangiaceae bacterium]|nr:peptide ABC transporter substrate-binding protein [Polyangiaceae bacterium]